MEFKVGDVVKLKSHGPLMTISYIDPSENEYRCVWFVSSTADSASVEIFPHEVLEFVR